LPWQPLIIIFKEWLLNGVLLVKSLRFFIHKSVLVNGLKVVNIFVAGLLVDIAAKSCRRMFGHTKLNLAISSIKTTALKKVSNVALTWVNYRFGFSILSRLCWAREKSLRISSARLKYSAASSYLCAWPRSWPRK
jgi:hypothetical protein